jgi:hypothetical protein
MQEMTDSYIRAVYGEWRNIPLDCNAVKINWCLQVSLYKLQLHVSSVVVSRDSKSDFVWGALKKARAQRDNTGCL